jgi:RNA polymerase sigma-70 factor (ECF subfamily)
MQLRQKRGRSNVSLDEVWDNGDAWKDSIADTLVDIEGDYRQKQRLALLSQAISVLNPALRVVVETYRHHDCSIAELAERNRISVAAAKSRMLRARVALRGSSRLSKAR